MQESINIIIKKTTGEYYHFIPLFSRKASIAGRLMEKYIPDGNQ
jgi:hypothetical protein